MSRRVFVLVLALTMLLGAVPMAATEEIPDWRAAYKKMFTGIGYRDTRAIALADLDFDGTPELILNEGNAIVLMALKNGQPVARNTLRRNVQGYDVTDFALRLYRAGKAEYRWILSLESQAGGLVMHDELSFTIQNGGLILRPAFATVREGGKAAYYAGGKEISARAYEQRRTKYYKSLKDLNLSAPVAQSPILSSFDQASDQFAAQQAPGIKVKTFSMEKAKYKAGLGEQVQLSVRSKPAYATGRLTFQSSDESLATVDADGLVTIMGLKGNVTITASKSGKTSACKITLVPSKAARLTLSMDGEIGAFVGQVKRITATLNPGNLSPQCEWLSSNPAVATVSADGVVTALTPGITKITAKCETLSAYLYMTVVEPAGETSKDVTRRAVVACNGSVEGGRQSNDQAFRFEGLQLINAIAQSGFGGEGRISSTLIVGESDGKVTLERIKAAFEGADDNDVSYLFLVGHGGNPVEWGQYIIVLGSDDWKGVVPITQLRDTLDQVRGKVVIIMNNCFSGDAISKSAGQAESWNNAFIKAFTQKAVSKSGELATEKYQVLCAASGSQSGWGWYTNMDFDPNLQASAGMSLMMTGVCEATGWAIDQIRLDEATYAKGAWRADRNGDNRVTMDELYTYVYARVRELYFEFPMTEVDDYLATGAQSVQVWPENSDFVVFAK